MQKKPLYELLKSTGDYFFAVVILIFLFPLIIMISLIIRFSGRGPVFYSQDRIGRNGRPFQIYKFRSMAFNAESGGPMLSGSNSELITPAGKLMRKYRIDEIPNFINVLKGDMSVVGPRPEREFYIDQIVKVNPDYLKLHSVKPGITSWGQVKFGYASNVDEMLKRLEYDLYYLEHRSLLFDLKIVMKTIVTIIRGKGK